MKYPLLLKPHFEYPIWSGRKLIRKYNKKCDKVIGESWEMSTISDKESVVANGNYKGCKLSDVLKLNPLRSEDRQNLICFLN